MKVIYFTVLFFLKKGSNDMLLSYVLIVKEN